MYLDDIYRLELCVTDAVMPDGPKQVYEGLKQFWDAQENKADHSMPPRKPIIGCRIINSYTGSVPTACEPWHNTMEEALEDYNKNILHISGGNTTAVAGLRKPTLFEEIKSFDLSQMSAFVKALTENRADRIYPALIQAKTNSYQKGDAIDTCGQILSVTDESADASVPDIPPVIDGRKQFTVTLPEGYLTINGIETDPAGKTGFFAELYDRNKTLISSASLVRSNKNGMMSLTVTEDEQNKSKPVILPLYHLPEILPGEFPPDMEHALRGVLFDANLLFKDYHLTDNGQSWHMAEFNEKKILCQFETETGTDTEYKLLFAWGEPFDYLHIQAVCLTEPETVLDKTVEITEECSVWDNMRDAFEKICNFAEDKGWAYPF